jgi:hypothetical protein
MQQRGGGLPWPQSWSDDRTASMPCMTGRGISYDTSGVSPQDELAGRGFKFTLAKNAQGRATSQFSSGAINCEAAGQWAALLRFLVPIHYDETKEQPSFWTQARGPSTRPASTAKSWSLDDRVSGMPASPPTGCWRTGGVTAGAG